MIKIIRRTNERIKVQKTIDNIPDFTTGADFSIGLDKVRILDLSVSYRTENLLTVSNHLDRNILLVFKAVVPAERLELPTL